MLDFHTTFSISKIQMRLSFCFLPVRRKYVPEACDVVIMPRFMMNSVESLPRNKSKSVSLGMNTHDSTYSCSTISYR